VVATVAFPNHLFVLPPGYGKAGHIINWDEEQKKLDDASRNKAPNLIEIHGSSRACFGPTVMRLAAQEPAEQFSCQYVAAFLAQFRVYR